MLWTGIADGAFCSALSWNCLTYIPYALIGGSLFALPSLILEAMIVVLLVRLFGLRISQKLFIALVSSQAIIGFIIGITFLKGQGP